jgi:aryl-alcohol dehydrogenase (NADP+)
MDYTKLGSTGLKVSRICLGMMTYGSKQWRDWVLEEEASRPFIQRALELGINFFDTADVYSLGVSEEILGRALRDFGPSRDKVVIATKVFSRMGDDPNAQGLSRKHIHHSIDDSLRRLGTDYVDLYQIHRADPETPIEETLDALNELVSAGKVLYLGASSMFAWQFARMLYKADQMGVRRFAAMQDHYNIVYREEEREMLPLCADQGVGVIPWSPLARGRLAREWGAATARSETDAFGQSLYAAEDRLIAEQLARVADSRGMPRAQIALAWLGSRPAVSAPIVGATRPQHLQDAVASLSIELTPGEIEQLEQPYVPHRIAGHG